MYWYEMVGCWCFINEKKTHNTNFSNILSDMTSSIFDWIAVIIYLFNFVNIFSSSLFRFCLFGSWRTRAVNSCMFNVPILWTSTFYSFTSTQLLFGCLLALINTYWTFSICNFHIKRICVLSLTPPISSLCIFLILWCENNDVMWCQFLCCVNEWEKKCYVVFLVVFRQ